MTIDVLHLTSGSLDGGATRGALWLHDALCKSGVRSLFFNDTPGHSDDPTVICPADTLANRMAYSLRSKMGSGVVRLASSVPRPTFSLDWPGQNIAHLDNFKKADIIHLHWVRGTLLNLEHLARFKKPIVWTMRDMWPMTGGCHYALDCRGYTSGCGLCPQLGSSRQHDLSWLGAVRKQKYISKHIRFVGISQWLVDCARESSVLREADLEVIPNCIDTSLFYPDRGAATRRSLGIPDNARVVLCGAQKVDSFYKGFSKFIDAVNRVSEDIVVICFGGVDPHSLEGIRKPLRHVGFVDDSAMLRGLYSAADVFVAPSIQEAFGKTLVESMSCGTPVVAFDATGPKDVVTHKLDGYLAIPFSPPDLAAGISWILSHPNPELLAAAAREKVARKFDSNVVAELYTALYERLRAKFLRTSQPIFLGSSRKNAATKGNRL